jgi:hypothetical protein
MGSAGLWRGAEGGGEEGREGEDRGNENGRTEEADRAKEGNGAREAPLGLHERENFVDADEQECQGVARRDDAPDRQRVGWALLRAAGSRLPSKTQNLISDDVIE